MKYAAICFQPEMAALSGYRPLSQTAFCRNGKITFFWSPESKPHSRFWGKFSEKSSGLPTDDYDTLKQICKK